MNFFRFKQFQITDDRSAMKVGTDSVILGAWVNANNIKSILDIGCGSGLISIILAQRYQSARITGVELESESIKDAVFNVKNSPWKSRMTILHFDIRNYHPTQKFDLIVANPPFFKDSLLPFISSRADARHDHSLSLIELMESTTSLLSEDGVFTMVFPFDREDELLNIAAKYNLFPSRILHSKNMPNALVKRSFIEFRKSKSINIHYESLDIRNAENQYSDNYRELTKAFYLKF